MVRHVGVGADGGDGVEDVVAPPCARPEPHRLGDPAHARLVPRGVEYRAVLQVALQREGRNGQRAAGAQHVQKCVDDGLGPAVHVSQAAERAVHEHDVAGVDAERPQAVRYLIASQRAHRPPPRFPGPAPPYRP